MCVFFVLGEGKMRNFRVLSSWRFYAVKASQNQYQQRISQVRYLGNCGSLSCGGNARNLNIQFYNKTSGIVNEGKLTDHFKLQNRLPVQNFGSNLLISRHLCSKAIILKDGGVEAIKEDRNEGDNVSSKTPLAKIEPGSKLYLSFTCT